MEPNKLSDYEIANISANDKIEISELEKTMSTKSDKDIILIAYQAKESAVG